MNRVLGRMAENFPWGATTVVAAVVVLGGLALIQTPGLPGGTFGGEKPATAGILLTDMSQADEAGTLEGELALKDPTPLFLPTNYNSGQVDLAMTVERAPGSSFAEFSPKLVFSGAASDLDIPAVVEVPGTAVGALQQMEAPVSGAELSRRDVGAKTLPGRRGVLKVLTVAGGEIVHEEVLDVSEVREVLEAPVEALLAVNTEGWWLQPTVVESPAGVPVDFAEINLLLREARLGSVLRPGFYRILLGP